MACSRHANPCDTSRDAGRNRQLKTIVHRLLGCNAIAFSSSICASPSSALIVTVSRARQRFLFRDRLRSVWRENSRQVSEFSMQVCIHSAPGFESSEWQLRSYSTTDTDVGCALVRFMAAARRKTLPPPAPTVRGWPLGMTTSLKAKKSRDRIRSRLPGFSKAQMFRKMCEVWQSGFSQGS